MRKTAHAITPAPPRLPPDQIGLLVGPRLFARARTYVKDGAVRDLKVEGSTVTGHVFGTGQASYQVDVSQEPDGSIAAVCDCPPSERGVCKHAAALLLAFWEQGEAPAAPPEPPQKPGRKPRATAAQTLSLPLDVEPPEAPAETPPKRKPGRPRKHPLPASETPIQERAPVQPQLLLTPGRRRVLDIPAIVPDARVQAAVAAARAARAPLKALTVPQWAVALHSTARPLDESAPVELPGNLDPRSLDEWARAHGVTGQLERSLQEAVPEVAWKCYEFRHYSLRQILLTKPASGRRSPWRSDHQADAQAGARRYLAEQAQLARRALQAEQTRFSRWIPPADPLLAGAFQRLLALRQELRAQAQPQAPGDPANEQVTIETDPPGFVFTSTALRPCRSAAETLEVRIDAGDGDRRASARCGCTGPCAAAPCGPRLAALDAALDRLAAPEHVAPATMLRGALATPRWSRALDALDAALDELAAAGADDPLADGELGWEIERGYRSYQIYPLRCRPAKRGGYSATRVRYRDLVARRGELPDPVDSRILTTLAPTDGTSSADRSRQLSVASALRLLVGHPRVFMADEMGGRSQIWLRNAPLALEVESDGQGGALVSAHLAGRHWTLPELAQHLESQLTGGILITHEPAEGAVGWLTPLDPAIRPLIGALAERTSEFPAESLSALLGRLGILARHIEVRLDDALGWAVPPDLRLRVRLELTGSASLNVRLAVQPLAEVSLFTPGAGQAHLLALRQGRVVHVRRDLSQEAHAARRLAQWLGLPDPDAPEHPFNWALDDLELGLEVLDKLRFLSGSGSNDGLAPKPADLPEVQVEWASPQRRQVQHASLEDLQLGVSRTRDMLEVGGGLKLSGQTIPLAELLAGFRGGQKWVSVAGDRWLRLDDALRKRLEPLAAMSRIAGNRVEVAPVAAPALAELGRGESWLDTRGWGELLGRVREAGALQIEQPRPLRAELRPYQRAGFEWLARLAHWAPGACLADDMGLGKTIQALALLLRHAPTGPALVIAPTSVGFGWLREAKRFAPALTTTLFRGKGQRGQLFEPGRWELIITSYDLAVRYLDELKRTHWTTVVLDEAQAIKNPTTQRARAVQELQADFCLALTGTPVENRTSELWSLFQCVSPGLLGSQESFRERFAVPIERDQDQSRRALLGSIIRPFLLRRLKSEVAPELPPRTEVQLDIELSDAERELYETIRRSALQELEGPREDAVTEAQKRIQVLAALTRLRQAACHPQLVDAHSNASSSKLEALRELIAELADEGHRALIFSQFTRLLDRARKALTADGLDCRYLDGSTPAVERQREIDAFQSGKGDVFLVSLKAGGTGLNLTAADYVIHLDPWWNPAVEDQATDRAHRIGQDKPVTVYRLVARRTIEEAVLTLHAEKRALVAALLAGTGTAATLDSAELLRLLSSEGVEDDAA